MGTLFVMGNTMYYTKATGQTFSELRYDVWGFPDLSGKLQNNDNGNFVAANFTGHTYDTVLDIYFAEARFYDAKYRQWMASNPIKDGLNWYEYCGSNPVSRIDPTGLYSKYFNDIYCDNPDQNIQSILNQLPAELRKYITPADITLTKDGMFILNKSLGKLLGVAEIQEFWYSKFEGMESVSLLNDWFLYGVMDKNGIVFSTLKVRDVSTMSSGNMPSVSIPFNAFEPGALNILFKTGELSESDKKALESLSNMIHSQGEADSKLRDYFSNPSSLGSYAVADFIISKTIERKAFDEKGEFQNTSTVTYNRIFESGMVGMYQQASENTKKAFDKMREQGQYLSSKTTTSINWYTSTNTVTETFRIVDVNNLTLDEYNMILSMNTGDFDTYSYAGENQYHAQRVNNPLLKEQAIKSDAGIGENTWLAPIFENNWMSYTGKNYVDQKSAHPDFQ